MKRFECDNCRQWALLPQMHGWVQEWCGGRVRHICQGCRKHMLPTSTGAVLREFFIDGHHLLRTRALRPHHHVVPWTAV